MPTQAMTTAKFTPGGASSPLPPSGLTVNGNARIRNVADSAIRLIDDAIESADRAFGATASGGTRILEHTTAVITHDWRFNVRKLAMLTRLQEGWDYPNSQPMDRGAEANFLDWITRVPPDRMDDAEPMLTDEGHIRLEWRRDDYVRIAEIGSSSLFLAVLTPNRVDDDAEEFDHYDAALLDRFFFKGTIR